MAELRIWVAAAPVALAASLTETMLAETSCVPVDACSTLRARSPASAADCSSTADAMEDAMESTSSMVLPIAPMAVTASLRRSLDPGDLEAPISSVALARLVGQVLDLGRHHHAKTLAAHLRHGAALDGRVQGQQVGLLGDVGDQVDHLADLAGRLGPAPGSLVLVSWA